LVGEQPQPQRHRGFTIATQVRMPSPFPLELFLC
jgi:hypothetical protein